MSRIYEQPLHESNIAKIKENVVPIEISIPVSHQHQGTIRITAEQIDECSELVHEAHAQGEIGTFKFLGILPMIPPLIPSNFHFQHKLTPILFPGSCLTQMPVKRMESENQLHMSCLFDQWFFNEIP